MDYTISRLACATCFDARPSKRIGQVLQDSRLVLFGNAPGRTTAFSEISGNSSVVRSDPNVLVISGAPQYYFCQTSMLQDITPWTSSAYDY